MGWRDEKTGYVSITHGGGVLERVARDYDSDADLGDGDWLLARLMEEAPADRIALARELLEGTGRVVARDVGKVPAPDTPLLPIAEPIRLAFRAGWVSGYNSCRAVMLEDAK